MFPSLLREGEIVRSPTGRLWIVDGWTGGQHKVRLSAYDDSGDECELSPLLLRHADSKHAGQLLVNMSEYGIKTL